ncbi:MAG: glycine cleavage T C-terminal barrel domain-containing protein [Hyphomicrobiales bacterium]
MKLFGARAVESMRMEKGFLHWKSDLLTEFDPFETGLGRFVKMDKDEFIGKQALTKRVSKKPAKRLVTLQIDTTHAPAHGGGSLIVNGNVAGTITSGDWGHRVNMNLAYAFIDAAFAEHGCEMELDLCGDLVKATVIPSSPYDPDFEKLRS